MIFRDVGDLPTGFRFYTRLSRIELRAMLVEDMPLVSYAATSVRGIAYLVKLVGACSKLTDKQIGMLTDGDFQFLLSWIRKASYPSVPTHVRWNCNNKIFIDEDFNPAPTGTPTVCGHETNELVNNASLQIHTIEDDVKLPWYMDLPRVKTLLEQEELLSEDPGLKMFSDVARWLRFGKTLKQKMFILSHLPKTMYFRLDEARSDYEHGITMRLPLRCRRCGFQTVHYNSFDYKRFFSNTTEQDVMDIQYSLLGKLGLQPDGALTTKSFLYINSSLAKDLNKDAENANVQRELKRSLQNISVPKR